MNLTHPLLLAIVMLGRKGYYCFTTKAFSG